MKSAALRGGFEKVLLHHDDDLSATPHWTETSKIPGFETRLIDPEEIFPDPDLLRIYRRLTAPAAKSNMVRAAMLSREGGVYMDLDTVTIADLTPLREASAAFCGEEIIALPTDVHRTRDPRILATAGARIAFRELCRRIPRGFRLFQKLDQGYPRQVNNAVLASEPEHPFILELLRQMAAVPRERQRVRFALGTHLLADLVENWDGEGLEVYPSTYFYPLGPEVSHHWFRQNVPFSLAELLAPETVIVHWYASVRTKEIVPRISPDTVKRYAASEPFSALALPFIR